MTLVLDYHGFTATEEHPGPPPKEWQHRFWFKLSGQGITGDSILEGNEEALVVNMAHFRLRRVEGDRALYWCAGCSVCRPHEAARLVAQIAKHAAFEALSVLLDQDGYLHGRLEAIIRRAERRGAKKAKRARA